MSDDRPFWEDDVSYEWFLAQLDLPPYEPPDAAGHLSIAWEGARDGVLSDLTGFAYGFAKSFAESYVELKKPLLVDKGTSQLLSWPLLNDPWFRRAAELALAEVAIDRAISGFGRLHEMQTVSSQMDLDERAVRYLREVSQLFLFGFHGPCIAFCGASLEQVLKEALVKARHLSEADVRAGKMSAGEVLDIAKREQVIVRSATEASRILHERNRAMHRHLWDERIIATMAVTSINDLLAVLTELQAED